MGAAAPGTAQSWVLHVDLDQFIAAVEMLRRPELIGLPVVVGGRGDPTERGVVATASYAAREHGVGSGMPLRIAARKLPDAVFLPVDKDAYNEASDQVMATLRWLTWGGVPVVVEVLGWDEAFLGPGEGHGDLGDPRDFAQHVRATVEAATRLTCGVGIGDNKLRAKIATAFGKAGEGDGSGIGYLTAAEWYDVMGDRPTTALWGIGSKIGKRLAALGIHTVRDLADSDARVLAEAIGPTMGPWYHRLGRGADTSPVDATPWVPRAHGREETYQTDLTWDVVPDELRTLTRRVVLDIDREGRPAARVGIKVRYRPFITVSRSLTLPAPTNDPAVLADAAVTLLDRVEHDRPVRLLGVRLEMVPPEGGYAR
ncbi:MAG: DNA polymerase IV [Nocardioides sp.]